MKNLIRKIKNLLTHPDATLSGSIWLLFFSLPWFWLSGNFWYKNRMTEYAVRSSQNTLQLHINALYAAGKHFQFLLKFSSDGHRPCNACHHRQCGRMSQRPAFHSEHLCPAALSLRQYQRTFVLCPMVGCLSHEKQPD